MKSFAAALFLMRLVWYCWLTRARLSAGRRFRSRAPNHPPALRRVCTPRVEREIDTGVMPVEIDGPHGLAISPDGQSFFVSLAHGLPNGALWKDPTTTGRPVRPGDSWDVPGYP